jgi:hypothetical protein
MTPHVTANWSALVPRGRSGPRDPTAFSDNVIAAKERVGRALRAVGPELAGVLVDVCCELHGLATTGGDYRPTLDAWSGHQ